MVNYKIETFGKMFVVEFERARAERFHACLLGLGLTSFGYRKKYRGRIEKLEDVKQFLAEWKYPKKIQPQPKKIDSLCVSCEKCDGRCSWSRKPIFQPVPGWVAEETTIRCGEYKGKVRTQKSYLVRSCPEYERIKLVGRRA